MKKKLCVLWIFDYVFCWSTWHFCWTVGPVFKQNQRFRCKKTGWIMTKPRTCSIQKLYLRNGCYLHYTFSYHIAKYLKRNPPTQKCSSVEDQWPNKGNQHSYLQFQRKLLVLWGNVFFETRYLQSIKMEKVHSVQNCRPGQRGKKIQGCHATGMWFCINEK